MEEIRIIVSGGGTGGHIFPAVSIANAIREIYPEAKILFIGAENRMEMQRVPEAGYNIVGLPVEGFNRKKLLKNIWVIYKLLKSQIKAGKVIKQFKPQVVIGVGGYASGPTLKMASMRGIPTLIQEQNSYAGITNKLLAKKVNKICVAYEGMERFFPKEKIILTGNPIRQQLLNSLSHEKAVEYFGLDPRKKTILILGGSLGARTINNTIIGGLSVINQTPEIQFIWQTGKIYYQQVCCELRETGEISNLYVCDFIKEMPIAYAAADLVISRAGAGSISEFCALHKPVILVPSPNVAEDHQTKNALALVNKNAALYVKDSDAQSKLLDTALKVIKNEDECKVLSTNIGKLALPNAAQSIAKEVLKLINR